MTSAFINWSGGKDCTFALHQLLEENKYKPEFLFTTCSREFNRVSMHGVRKELITRQGFSLGIHSRKLYVPQDHTIETYNKHMYHEMLLMKQRGIEHAVFGDIFLEDLKKYREERLSEVGLKGVFPLWKKDTKELLKNFIALGYKTIIICINANRLNRSFLGRTIDEQFLTDLPTDVDCCGENGEFHTFVYDGPIFKTPIPIVTGESDRKSTRLNSSH